MKRFVYCLCLIFFSIRLTGNALADDPEEAPWNDRPAVDENITGDDPIEAEEVLPIAPYIAAALQAPSPALTFQGLGDTNTFIPPDTDGAVGPYHVMTMLNTEVRVQDRT